MCSDFCCCALWGILLLICMRSLGVFSLAEAWKWAQCIWDLKIAFSIFYRSWKLWMKWMNERYKNGSVTYWYPHPTKASLYWRWAKENCCFCSFFTLLLQIRRGTGWCYCKIYKCVKVFACSFFFDVHVFFVFFFFSPKAICWLSQ